MKLKYNLLLGIGCITILALSCKPRTFNNSAATNDTAEAGNDKSKIGEALETASLKQPIILATCQNSAGKTVVNIVAEIANVEREEFKRIAFNGMSQEDPYALGHFYKQMPIQPFGADVDATIASEEDVAPAEYILKLNSKSSRDLLSESGETLQVDAIKFTEVSVDSKKLKVTFMAGAKVVKTIDSCEVKE